MVNRPRSVSTADWAKVKALLLDVLGHEPEERTAYLNSQKVGAHIREEVGSLLAFEPDGPGFLDGSAISLSKEYFTDSEYSVAGQKIGAYRIVSELGIGGMGAVYLADRTDGKFEQRVAIKLLRREFNIGKVRASFDREIAIQAKLVHPNIAAVLDTGTTDEGIPYIVMEYIAGLPIDKYCHKNDLGLNARLKLFNRVCDAVAFAHQNLIVHRDLKPSNIIVTPEGEPRLLDFGISKLLDAADSSPSSATIMGAMTPEYASPEQIRGEAVSTATDIYSLGVILFKLLTGVHPHDLHGKVNGDVLKEITDSEPMAPSQAARLSRDRQVSSAQLRGDPDKIILKALRKEPEGRYRTVEQFTDDIWRFIDGLPVEARSHSLAYRSTKFFKRNRVSVIAAAVVFLSLIAGLTAALWQMKVARTQANIARIESESAKAEQEKSEKISKFMAKIISYANPRWDTDGAKSNGQAKVIDVLFEMSDRIDTEFPDNPDIQAELHHKFAEVFQRVSRPFYSNPRATEAEERAKAHARRAFELRRQFYGDHHELVAKDMAYLVWTQEWEPAESAKVMAQAIQMMRETNPKNLNLPYMLADYAGGLMLPSRGESAYETKYPRQQYQTTYLAAAIPPASGNQFELGEQYLREALPLMRSQYGEDNYAIFVTECYLAFSLAKQEKWAEFSDPYQACKQGETRVGDETSRVGMKKVVGWVQDVLDEKRRPDLK